MNSLWQKSTFFVTFLDTLNLEVQGREKSIADLVDRLCAFKTKLTIFTSDLMSGRLLHFSQLCAFTFHKYGNEPAIGTLFLACL